MSLKDPVTVRGTIKRSISDEDGEIMLTLRLPVTESLNAAKLNLLRKIVFDITFTPNAAETEEAGGQVL